VGRRENLFMDASGTKSGKGENAGRMPGAPRPAVVAALRRVLRPIVRLLLGHGITFPYLGDLLKLIYVETAEAEFALGLRPLTDSRITLLTGVHRKDVRHLRREVDVDAEPAPSLTLGTRIVARWLGDPSYLTREGGPRPLQRTPHKGGTESFAALVEKVSKNVRPRSVLDELVRLGVVEVDADDCVHLVTGGFVPGKDLDAKAFYFGEALHDHLAAAVHNLGGGSPAWLERSVYYDELSPDAVEKLTARSEQLSMQVLQEINREGMALEASDPPSPDQRMRVRLGIYFYAEPVSAMSVPSAPKASPRKPKGSRK
jgi:hypothetical protein